MTGAEMVECGELMAAHAAGMTTPDQQVRMKELQRRAKVELPHDDPSTPDVDEGRTAIVQEMITKGEWQDRLIAVEKKLEQLACAAAGAAFAELPELIAGALTKR